MPMSPFEQIDQCDIKALRISLESYSHRATGARHYHFACDDTNNAFMVAFPTLPTDSTGVAHMLEHTTLCGSRRFPVRDPFFMMLRRSLNTFMNAFTSGDTTAYPFATQNSKDFYNLLQVYLDAVFFPTLDPLDFAQEGWRLDFADSDNDDELVFKGVVYNEMKGAMSAPSSQLWQQLHSTIFSDTVYRHNSGGDPAHIPDLSYDDLKAFHTRHYHPSHAVFMTYGNFPVTRHHDEFEQLALNAFERRDADVKCPMQKRFDKPSRSDSTYAVATQADLERGTHAVWAWLLGRSVDPVGLLEAHLLSSLLLDHSGSPLRHYLETTELADGPSELCGLDDSGQELVFLCGVEGSEAENIAPLEQAIDQVLQTVARDGVELAVLEGIIDRMEMSQRDIGGDSYPYGLQLMSRAMPGALYDGDVAALLDVDPALASLRERIAKPGYVQALVRDLLIVNTHRVCVVMRPDAEQATREQISEATRLAAILQKKSALERQAIRNQATLLDTRQDEEQDADLLPKVGLADVPATVSQLHGEEVRLGRDRATQYSVATNGLVYMQLCYALPSFSAAELADLPHFCEYLTELGAGSETYVQTQSRRALLGNVGAYAQASASIHDEKALSGRFVLTTKGLNRRSDLLVDNLFETLSAVRFDEREHLGDLLSQSRLDAEASITDRGHVLAMHSAARSLSASGYLDDLWDGPTSIVRAQTLDHEREKLDELVANFESIRTKLLSAPRQILVIAEDEMLSSMQTRIEAQADSDQSPTTFSALVAPSATAAKPCAWITNTQVNFCAKAYAAVGAGHRDAPALAVLARYLSDGFLHPAIREKGGAYGGGAQFDADSASFRFYSYRDPRLSATIADFDRSLDWLVDANDAQRLEESILGVIRTIDSPRSPAGSAIQAFYNVMDGRSEAFRNDYRQAVLATTFDDVRQAAERYLSCAQGSIAAVTHAANESDIEALQLQAVKL